MRATSRDPTMLRSANAARKPNDIYATIDTRCVAHLNKVFPLQGISFIEPMAGYGDLVKQIEHYGGSLEWAGDLIEHEGRDPRIIAPRDIFDIPADDLLGATIITNPAFTNQRQIVRHFLNQKAVSWLVLLMRSSQMHVGDMQELLKGGRLYGVAPLPFRPRWFPLKSDSQSPRHEYAWFIWRPRTPVGLPKLLLAPGDPNA
jgi:hypothetical protein